MSEQAPFWGYDGILPEFSQACPKNFWGHIMCEHFFKQTFFWDDLQKKVFMWFCKSWVPFRSNKTTRWAPFFPRFSEICKGFHRFCPYFHVICPDCRGFCPDSHQIKTFGGALAPPPPTPLSEKINCDLSSLSFYRSDNVLPLRNHYLWW